MASTWDGVQRKWADASQGQIFEFENQLSAEEKQLLLKQIENIDPTRINEIYGKVMKERTESHDPDKHVIEPMPTFKCSTDDETKNWSGLGYQAIAAGKVVILLMAGGQGTRLGSKDPKGMFDVGLPSKKSLFQIQAERILRLQELTQQATATAVPPIPWYIMDSELVQQATRDYFQQHSHFGLKPEQVQFFTQDEFPCLSPEGKVILESKSKIAESPNGNGGIWEALYRQGHLEHFKSKGVEWIATYGVDNILSLVCDPLFLGFCIDKKLDIGSKVVPKAYPEERVGLLATRDNQFTVLEYSEINEANRLAKDSNGELKFRSAHLGTNTYNLDFVYNFCSAKMHLDLPYHVAFKQIPYASKDGQTINPEQPNGYKFELFAFDIFSHAKAMCAFETTRPTEFSPLKNSTASPTDNPNTCKKHLSDLHKSFILKAGGQFSNPSEEAICEISPLVSYAGEGLEWVNGKIFALPCHIDSHL